ncbi:MAG: S46 family peptidase [Candidatus Saccharimonadaceae bacterium]
MKKSIFTLLLGIFVSMASADEGMWMLHLLKQQKLAEMHALGLKLLDADIYNLEGNSLKDAVVQFGSGCTGEVVSSQGLVLTNHHCGYSQIQSHSTLEANYLETGFWAMSQADELSNPGLTVTFIEKVEDVTDFVKKSLERDKEIDVDGVFFLSPKYLNNLARDLVGVEYLEKNKSVDVEIKPFFEGNQYYMFTKKLFSDVRLVGSPPSSIGKFGADTDNWTWPRHSGDFSVFRIYADKDGNPANYSPDNVPLRPKRWLKISTKGVEENDFAMLLGFPGTTNKFYTSWEVQERRDIDNEVRINMRDIRQRAMLEEMLNEPEINIQYASKYSGSTNAYKNAIGTSWAIGMRDFEASKKEQQDRLLSWAKKNNKPEYIEALNTIEQIVTDRAGLRYRSWMLNEGIKRGIEFSTIPLNTVDSLIVALNAENMEGKEKYMLKLMGDYRKFADKNYSSVVDMKVSKVMLQEYITLIPYEDLPDALRIIHDKFEGNVNAFVDYLFEKSIFGNIENMQSFISGTHLVKDLENDPMVNFAQSIKSENIQLNDALSAYENKFNQARRTYLKGMLEMDGPTTYFPDANLTMRLSYGQVKGYEPRDCIYYGHQTTLEGIMEKEDPNSWEFIVSDKLKDLYKTKDFGPYKLSNGKMPVDFAATTHTTGGNSGSPVMNGDGELIGINFDRNWEGVGGDIQYLPDYQRSIIVDIRFVLFVIDKYAGATHLIEEMDIN